jgi:hypothetical protein
MPWSAKVVPRTEIFRGLQQQLRGMRPQKLVRPTQGWAALLEFSTVYAGNIKAQLCSANSSDVTACTAADDDHAGHVLFQ